MNKIKFIVCHCSLLFQQTYWFHTLRQWEGGRRDEVFGLGDVWVWGGGWPTLWYELMALRWHLAAVYTCSSLKSHRVTPKRARGRRERRRGKTQGEASHYDDSSIKLAPFPSTVGHCLTLIFVTLPFSLNTGVSCGNNLGCLVFVMFLETHRDRKIQAAPCHWNNQRLFHRWIIIVLLLSAIDLLLHVRSSSYQSSDDLQNNYKANK